MKRGEISGCLCSKSEKQYLFMLTKIESTIRDVGALYSSQCTTSFINISAPLLVGTIVIDIEVHPQLYIFLYH